MSDAEESILVRSAIAGDYHAFAQLAARHEKRLYALAWHLTHDHHDAQDIVQNALTSVVEHLSGFRGESSFATWLTRITVNFALKTLRQRRARRARSLDEEDDRSAISPPQYIADWHETPEATLDQEELRQVLDEGLAKLSEGQRLVFVLRDIEAMSTADTAELLNITQANAKVRLLRARLALREYLTVRFGDERTRQSPSHDGHDHASLLERIGAAQGTDARAPGGEQP